MASSSNIPEVKYDVFLSFRGEDTRYNFTSHLNAALCGKKIQTFIDDKLDRGEEISSFLLKAIEQSKISVIILSENYASSRWCLEELAKILECKKMVIPIFYHVEPSDVRNQTGAFGEAFNALKKRFEERLDVLQRWETALREVANLAGWPTDSMKPESKFIEEIVSDILKRLNKMSPSDYGDLIGVESAIKEIESLLEIGSSDVCIVGIWGIGGIGKTSISRAIFNKYSNDFEGSFFAENVREELNNCGRLTVLREELFFKILGDKYANIGLTFTKDRLARKKVLIVFDDVTSLNQIENLIDLNCLGLGSRIIVTSRDKQVLKNVCRESKIYELEGLSHNEAFKLFSRYAFRHNGYIIAKEYMELSKWIVLYAKGVPLALKVLGSSLSGNIKQEWENVVNKLKRSLHEDIQNVLKIGYDGLNYEQKQIFLAIACCLKGKDRDIVIGVMDFCGYFTATELSVLLNKCLIIVSNNKITMHDLLEEMGREIVRQESVEDPGKRSYLFHHEDLHHVLTKNEETKDIKGICLDVSQVEEIHLTPHVFSKMPNLKYLNVYGSRYEGDFNKHAGTSFPSKLIYLCWHSYAWTSLPLKFHPENLVVLEMRYSNIEELWPGIQHIVNLKHIDLRGSTRLLKCPDLSLAKNLETLNFEWCKSLIEIHSSIQYLNKLSILNLAYCRSLRSIPSGIYSESLQKVDFTYCSELDTVPSLSCNVEELCLGGTAIRELPLSIENLSKLVTLNLEDCKRLESLPSSICELKSLETLLIGCSNVKLVPKLPCNIRELLLDYTAIKDLPSSIEGLSKLKRLSLFNCSRLENLPSSILSCTALEEIELSGCTSLKIVSSLPCNLRILTLCKSTIQELPLSIQHLSKLQTLNLSDCQSLESLPSSIGDLKSLKYLFLNGCLKLNSLPVEIGNLEALIKLAAGDTGIREVPSSIVCLNNLETLSFTGSKGEEHVGLILPPLSGLQHLMLLDLSDCGITELPSGLGQLTSLEKLNLARNKLESIPTSIINLSELRLLDVCYCDVLKSLPEIPSREIKAENCKSLELLSCFSTTQWFYFINCFKLDQNALEDIVKSALQNIQQSVSESVDYDIDDHVAIYPGNSIPEWCTFRSKRSYIELPSGCLNLNDDVLCLSFCTVLSLCEYDDLNESAPLVIKYVLYHKSDGEEYEIWTQCSTYFYASSIDSDHVILCYKYFRSFSDRLPINSEILFEFYVEHEFHTPLECFKVKECGVMFLPSTSGAPPAKRQKLA